MEEWLPSPAPGMLQGDETASCTGPVPLGQAFITGQPPRHSWARPWPKTRCTGRPRPAVQPGLAPGCAPLRCGLPTAPGRGQESALCFEELAGVRSSLPPP